MAGFASGLYAYVLVVLCFGSVFAAPFEANTMHGGATSQFSSADGGTFGSVSTKQRPISKVINLLKDMQAQLAKEGKEDEAAFEEMSCWCKTNDKLKTKAIEDAEQKIKSLSATIEENAAKASQMKTDIESLSAAITKGKKSLAEAGEVRDKELAEFNKEDKDAIVSIKGLHSAVETLSKHNAGAALNQEVMLQVHNLLSRHVGSKPVASLGLRGKQHSAFMSFLQQPVAVSSYLQSSGASGEIFGMLTSMKESFETNMASAREEEKTAAAEYESLKASKTEELAAANEQEDAKTAGLADAEETEANARTDLKDTEEQLEGDKVFLADLKEKCAKIDKEWEARQKMRQDETTALGQALEILSDGEARDLASKTTGFFQASMQTKASGKRLAASRQLEAAAQRLHRPKLSLLAMAMKSDVFDKMVKKIKVLIENLHKEKAEEAKHKDYCVGALHDVQLANDKLYHTQKNLKTKEADLTTLIQKLTDEMEAAKAEIAAAQIQMKTASEARKEESDDFTDVIADQRAMQAVLGKAVAKLRAFYDKAALLEDGSEEEQPSTGEMGFKPYRKGGGGMVIATLEHCIHGSHAVQTAAMMDNIAGQRAYEEFMRDLNKSVILLKKQISEQTAQKSQAQADLTRTEADLAQNMDDLEAQDTVNQEVHKDCDFIIENFKQRQQAFDDEVDALYEAIATMGGEE